MIWHRSPAEEREHLRSSSGHRREKSNTVFFTLELLTRRLFKYQKLYFYTNVSSKTTEGIRTCKQTLTLVLENTQELHDLETLSYSGTTRHVAVGAERQIPNNTTDNNNNDQNHSS